MKLRALNRQLLVRMDWDLIDAIKEKSVIAIPEETLEKLKGGCQIGTILSMGACAFDDAAPEELEGITVGRQVLTGRYPGHGIDLDPLASDAQVSRTRMISCDEVHALVATEEEEGADV